MKGSEDAGCVGWFALIFFAAIILWCLYSAMISPDPPGRCYQEPGPNGITINDCEPEN